MNGVNPVAGWYPDPDGFECERYWDGNNWTLQTRPKVKREIQNSKTANSSISAGWWLAIIGAGLICFLALAYLASDPTFY